MQLLRVEWHCSVWKLPYYLSSPHFSTATFRADVWHVKDDGAPGETGKGGSLTPIMRIRIGALLARWISTGHQQWWVPWLASLIFHIYIGMLLETASGMFPVGFQRAMI
jgi:hypothetical protein